ncbi:MAG: IS1 family transposase, partial [Pseudomonadota bacterium]|nr:IS1 family transposase [Pseudomonadota bacterium]
HMVAIWAVWYNWVRIHKSLRVTPAMQAGLTDTVWDWDMIVAKMDEIAPKAGRPTKYKKNISTK